MLDAPLANEIVAAEIKLLDELSGELDITLIGSSCCDPSIKKLTSESDVESTPRRRNIFGFISHIFEGLLGGGA